MVRIDVENCWNDRSLNQFKLAIHVISDADLQTLYAVLHRITHGFNEKHVILLLTVFIIYVRYRGLLQ
jgi:hypothetical protein